MATAMGQAVQRSPFQRRLAAATCALLACGAISVAPLPGSAAPAAVADLQSDDIKAMVDVLMAAPDQALSSSALVLDEAARKALASDDANERRKAEPRLIKAVEAYAGAEHGLQVDSKNFDHLWSIHPAAYDAAKDLNSAIKDQRLKAWLDALPPSSPAYAQLVAAYRTYRDYAKSGWKPLKSGKDMHEGEKDSRVAALRERLAAEGFKIADDGPPDHFTSALTDAVKTFQLRHGLPASGVVSRATVAALNVSAAKRAEQIAMNLERWRWLPRDMPTDRIEVNIAAQSLNATIPPDRKLHMLATSGKPIKDDETPMLISNVDTIILNPPWNVPHDIAVRELFPKQRRDHSYFEREDFKVIGHGAKARLVQQPGSKSALGRIKFDFKNPFSVYLHDTPEQNSFSSSRRSVSHGCVRLEQPKELAVALLAGQADWNEDKIDQTLKGTQTTPIKLERTEPVYLLYWTAVPSDDGVSFHDDVYHWDSKLQQLLADG